VQSGVTYRVRVRAENSEGVGLWSPNSTATTAATVPGSPLGLAAAGVHRTAVTLTWQAPGSDGGSPVLSYQVRYYSRARAHNAPQRLPCLADALCGWDTGVSFSCCLLRCLRVLLACLPVCECAPA
jgi:hypothetical protein